MVSIYTTLALFHNIQQGSAWSEVKVYWFLYPLTFSAKSIRLKLAYPINRWTYPFNCNINYWFRIEIIFFLNCNFKFVSKRLNCIYRIVVYQDETETRIFHCSPSGDRPAIIFTMLLSMVHTPDVVAIVSVASMPLRLGTGKHFVIQLRHVCFLRRRHTAGM